MADKVSVHVLVYDHKYGTDVSVYESYEQAKASAVDIILDWVHDLSVEHQFEVLKHILENQFEEAINLYEEHHGGEYLTITEHYVHDPGDFPSAEESIEEAKEKFKKLKEEQCAAQEVDHV